MVSITNPRVITLYVLLRRGMNPYSTVVVRSLARDCLRLDIVHISAAKQMRTASVHVKQGGWENIGIGGDTGALSGLLHHVALLLVF